MLNFVIDEILTHGVLFKAKFFLHIFSLGVTINGVLKIPIKVDLPLGFLTIGTYNTK